MSAIIVENLGKKYMISHQGREVYASLRDVLVKKVKSCLRRIPGASSDGKTGETLEEFWALRDVSFEVQHGDTIGIIG